MASRSAGSTSPDEASRFSDAGFWLVLAVGIVSVALVVFGMLAGATGPGSSGQAAAGSATVAPSASAPVDVASYLLPEARTAAPIELIDQTSSPFSLASLRGTPVFVFFGYTHCPDVCPATIGSVGEVLAVPGSGARALFVSVDPERDTPAWLKEFTKYMPAGFTALTGTATDIRATADAWGVKYAKVDTGTPDAYSMSHTADVFLVDADGTLRADFPFGTEPAVMTAVLREVVATTVSTSPTPGATPSGTPSPTATPVPSAATPAASASPGVAFRAEIVSSSVWSGVPGPIILTLADGATRIDDPSLQPTVQLTTWEGEPVGTAVTATAVRPPGESKVFYVATVAIPTAGAWRLQVTADMAGATNSSSVGFTALDPGTTASLGGAAPAAHTPTLDDVGGVIRAVTTDPAPDLRLSQTSTTDALAAGRPFVIVIDSVRFKVSPFCGRAVVMARYLLDRWPAVSFIHLEPYRYSVVTAAPVLEGTLDAPTLNDPAAAWGLGGDPWGAKSMPWVFVVDGKGVVRAKYQGVFGSDDVDVIVSLIAQGG